MLHKIRYYNGPIVDTMAHFVQDKTPSRASFDKYSTGQDRYSICGCPGMK